MNGGYELKKLEDVVSQYICRKKKIEAKKISLFSAPGENYGGILLKADLTLRNDRENGLPEYEDLSLIIKTIPPTEYFQILFNTQVSVKAEIAFYEVIVPTFNDFQTKHGIKTNDLFPEFYGGRISLDENSDKVDRDSIIALQNLQIEGNFFTFFYMIK